MTGHTVYECSRCGLLVTKPKCPVCKKEIEPYQSFVVSVEHNLDEE